MWISNGTQRWLSKRYLELELIFQDAFLTHSPIQYLVLSLTDRNRYRQDPKPHVLGQLSKKAYVSPTFENYQCLLNNKGSEKFCRKETHWPLFNPVFSNLFGQQPIYYVVLFCLWTTCWHFLGDKSSLEQPMAKWKFHHQQFVRLGTSKEWVTANFLGEKLSSLLPINQLKIAWLCE